MYHTGVFEEYNTLHIFFHVHMFYMYIYERFMYIVTYSAHVYPQGLDCVPVWMLVMQVFVRRGGGEVPGAGCASS